MTDDAKEPGTRGPRFTDEWLRPFIMGTLVVVTVVQFTTHPLIAPPLAIALLVVVSAITIGTLFSWPPSATFPIALAFAVCSAVLLAVAQSTLAPAFAFVASGSAGARLRTRVAIGVAVTGALIAVGAVLLVDELHPLDRQWPWWLGFAAAAPVYMGIARRERREALLSAERAVRSEAREAALLERGRIAREIHDVLGHSLSGIAMQLDMADALYGKGRGDEATQAVRRARALAVDSITETRHAIHALREDTLPLERTLELMATGEGVAFEIDGTPSPVPSEVAHAVIRAAQEALTNAAKHAPGADRSMKLGFAGETVSLTIENGPARKPADPGLAGGGLGLPGMRERVALLGGTLRAGPSSVDGWTVELEVPR
ncbi:Signal transduction histidine kinase [Amycolatopsis xylanica]|uniref:histidine kinase n=1 Tax=Amycolatopsis xylanica TaxID=589385 RepID=A0A1H3RNR3_9PSEU|nr:histidine kinase [Amycolatopsis xylanica]SDZ27270.1 Signal transduction histidine kinase [Amycolatopsis xylanica]